MDHETAEGTERVVDGRPRVFYEGYWIKSYPIPSDTLLEKRRLIEVLARRLFNHIEHGLYIPGTRLEEARAAYDTETDPARRRIKGGMLAAALFNRATDILTKLVELQAVGVAVSQSGQLMRECGGHLQEALTLGRLVLHRSGEEGIDELWGEPFKAFAFPVPEFYRSRYVKVGMTMRCIDDVATELAKTFEPLTAFEGVAPLVKELAASAKLYSETLRSDSDIFDVWASFAVAIEKLVAFAPKPVQHPTARRRQAVERGVLLLREGSELISHTARARVPMPKSTEVFLTACRRYAEKWGRALAANGTEAPGART
ncbi:MAG TPA: hypothetical protein VF103_16585 [Polyangiaceae bacterium]